MATLTFNVISNGTKVGTFTESTSTDAQTALAMQFVGAIAAAPSNVTIGAVAAPIPATFGTPASVPTTARTLTTPDFYTVGSSQFNLYPEQITGSAAVPVASVVLNYAGDSYVTGGTAVSTVVATDMNPVTIVNSNPGGALLAATGSAAGSQGDTLEGLTGANQFITGNAGRDAVLMFGAANSLTSNGSDVVLVGGPSTIAAAANGLDNVAMTSGTVLAFINQSNAGTVDSITGAANGIVLMAGPGSTSVTAGLGQEFLFLDTSAGNTTINASGSATTALTFIKDLTVGTANVVVNNFAAGGTVAVHGYAGFSVAASTTNAGGSVLSLSDGSQVSFSSLSASALQAAVRPI